MKPTTAYGSLKDGPVRTEARRIARDLVKRELKKAGIKISQVESSEISKAARHCLADPNLAKEIIKEAKREIYNRKRRKS